MLDNAQALSSGLEDIKAQLDSGAEEIGSDCYRPHTSTFYKRALPTVQRVSTEADRIATRIKEVLVYFGEDPKETQIEHLFLSVQVFLELVDRASEDNSRLSGKQILRSKTSGSPDKSAPSNFDGTLRAIREGRHGREASLAKDRPASRVFSFQ